MTVITNRDEAIAAVKQKINTEEQYIELGLQRYWNSSYGNGCNTLIYGADESRIRTVPWWAQREMLRMEVGVYSLTAALRTTHNASLHQYLVHVSVEDETMVAYTPSTEAGLADKQIKTTFGRFLRKHALWLSDGDIRKLETEHRAEFAGELRFATTAAEIQHVYQNMEGDSGCMRYEYTKWDGYTPDMHPSHVYEAPGMAVAYVELDGQIRSRSVVWTNPDDATDKRFVRLYGDYGVLQRKLQAEGFRLSHLAGARLKRIPVPGRKDVYVMPYLDGPGGQQSDYTGRYVMLDKDPTFLRIIGSSAAARLTAMTEHAAGLAGSHDTAKVRLVAAPATEVQCFFSGVMLDALVDEVHSARVLTEDGAVTQIRFNPHARVNDYIRNVHVEDKRSGAFIAAWALMNDAPADHPLRGKLAVPVTFDCFGARYVDTPAARKHCGYAQLDAALYPDAAGKWVYSNTKTLHDGRVVKDTDVVNVIVDESCIDIHTSDVAAYRKKGYVNASPVNVRRKCLVHKDNTDTEVSVGGTLFSKRFNGGRFLPLIDGRWELSSRVEQRYTFGVAVNVLKREPCEYEDVQRYALRTGPSAARIARIRANALQSASAPDVEACFAAIESEMLRLLRNEVGTPCRYTLANGYFQAIYGSNAKTWSDALACIEAMRMQVEANPEKHTPTGYESFCAAVHLINEAFGETRDVVQAQVSLLQVAEDDASREAYAKLEIVKHTLLSEIEAILG